MPTFQEMGYDELQRWIASGQGGETARMAEQEQTRRLLSGDATWNALQSALKGLVSVAPQDHDVFLKVSDLRILKASYVQPHTFIFEGISDSGQRAGIVMHYTQAIVTVVYVPRKNPAKPRVITGFAKI
jgi:hypothetical protein